MLAIAVCVLVLALSLQETHAFWGQYGRVATKSKPILVKGSLVSTRTLGACKHQICDYIDNYPEEEIDKAMENEHLLKYLISGTVFNTSADISIKSRLFYEAKSIQFCNVEGAVSHAPHAMRNINNDWKIIVNTKKYQQMFTVESCRQLASPDMAGKETKQYCNQFGFRCRQNYQSLSLLIYEAKKLRFDKFIIPTTCKCCAA